MAGFWLSAPFKTKSKKDKTNFKFDGKKVLGEVHIPENMEATFNWKGKTEKLKSGVNKISFLKGILNRHLQKL